MQPIEFIGIRGGHGTTTVALAAAATLATRGPIRISTHDRRALCAIVGIAHDGLPIPLAEYLDLAPDEHDGDVLDATQVQRLSSEFGISPNSFSAVLIGKDGGEKLRVNDVPDLQTIYAVIDGMPMRGREMNADPGRC